MDNRTRTVSALAAAVLLLGLASCGAAETPAAESGSVTTEPVSEVSTEPVYELAKADYGGKTVNMFLWDSNKFIMEEETGDVLNDAIFNRNRAVEEMYNVTFDYQVSPGGVSDWSKWNNTLNASIMAGDDEIQLAGGYGYRFAYASLEGGFRNFNDMPQIDFSRPWWPSNINEAGNLGGALYMVLGNIDTKYYDVTYLMCFNKRLANDQDIGDLYQLVRDGKWTVDAFNTAVKNSGADINGDSVMDIDDKYGFITGKYMDVDAWIDACDIKITSRDADDMPVLIGLTDHYVEVQQWFKALTEQEYVRYNDVNDNIFREGRALITTSHAGGLANLRDMADDFGVLPYPKWDEAQGEYQTYNALGNSTGFAVPVTADADMMGTLVEALSYLGWKDVLPQYYEKALKGKGLRDNESEGMLDIIFNNIHFDFTEFYSYVFGDQKSPSMLMRMTTLSKNGEIASMWAKDEAMYQATMESLIEKLK